jgi:hypothetical protein
MLSAFDLNHRCKDVPLRRYSLMGGKTLDHCIQGVVGSQTEHMMLSVTGRPPNSLPASHSAPCLFNLLPYLLLPSNSESNNSSRLFFTSLPI